MRHHTHGQHDRQFSPPSMTADFPCRTVYPVCCYYQTFSPYCICMMLLFQKSRCRLTPRFQGSTNHSTRSYFSGNPPAPVLSRRRYVNATGCFFSVTSRDASSCPPLPCFALLIPIYCNDCFSSLLSIGSYGISHSHLCRNSSRTKLFRVVK